MGYFPPPSGIDRIVSATPYIPIPISVPARCGERFHLYGGGALRAVAYPYRGSARRVCAVQIPYPICPAAEAAAHTFRFLSQPLYMRFRSGSGASASPFRICRSALRSARIFFPIYVPPGRRAHILPYPSLFPYGHTVLALSLTQSVDNRGKIGMWE